LRWCIWFVNNKACYFTKIVAHDFQSCYPKYTWQYEESPRKIIESDPRIDMQPPTRKEVETALKQIKGGKAPGTDNIPSDVLKTNVDANINILLPLLEKIWNEEKSHRSGKKG
jgi:hypothetical protein